MSNMQQHPAGQPGQEAKPVSNLPSVIQSVPENPLLSAVITANVSSELRTAAAPEKKGTEKGAGTTASAAPSEPKTFSEFWPGYLAAHSKPETRAVHYAGPALGAAWAAGCLAAGQPALALAFPVAAYGPLFMSHWFIEGNNPKTFRAPVWSFAAEFKMIYLGLTGKLPAELEKHGIQPVRKEWAITRFFRGRSDHD